jgi:hypothetical protein
VIELFSLMNSSLNHTSVGLNKDFNKMLSENAEFKALSLKKILTASDGTRKVAMIFSFCSCSS